jgi:hypothetical protein
MALIIKYTDQDGDIHTVVGVIFVTAYYRVEKADAYPPYKIIFKIGDRK